MQKSFIFMSIALIALLFSNPVGCVKSPSDQSAIRQCIQKNLRASQDEDIDAIWETFKPSSEQEKEQTTAILKMLFEACDLSYTIESYKLLKLEGDQADVEVVQVTKKISGPEFRDNRSTFQHSLKKIDGCWFIIGTKPMKIEYIN